MTQKVIIPAEEKLKIESDGCVCAVEGCGKSFQTSSQLYMHLTKHHQGKNLRPREGKAFFFCPVRGCPRSIINGKPFPRLGQLKQHYQSIHGDKTHACQKCGKLFSLRDVCSRHESECGKEFRCRTCGGVFRTRNALYKHAQRKNHTLPDGSKPMVKRSLEPSVKTIVIRREVVKLVNLVSSSTQTEQDDLDMCGSGSCFQTRRLSEQFEDQTSMDGRFHTTFLDLSTQTEPLEQSFDLSDLATQTNFTELFNFGTQTPHTSVNHTATQSSEDARNYIMCDCQQTENLELVEFGTQTLSVGEYPMATQTSPGDLYCNLSDLESRTDFGTQTIDELFSPILPPSCLTRTSSHSTTQLDFSVQAELPLNENCVMGGNSLSMMGCVKEQASQTSD